MINNLQSLLSSVLSTQNVSATSSTAITSSNNPFANPFMQSSTASQYYGKNTPVKGGYFAGYYNNKPNIVGRRLFLEV